MKKIILFLVVCLTFLLSNAQGSENFDNAAGVLPTGSTYADGSFVGNGGITWNYFHCQAAMAYPIDGEGILLRRSNEPSKITATFEGGIGSFSVDTRKGYMANAARNLELVINGVVVAQFTHTFPSGESNEVVPFVVNDINVEGTVNLELRMFGPTGNQHLVLDNISWTGYGGGTEPEPAVCDIVVNLSFPGYGDVVTWRLIDGSGEIVLTGGPYSSLTYNEFSITSSTYMAVNPPYSLQVVHASNTFWCDNDLSYTVTVGGVIDIQGEILDPCSGGTQTIPLNADLTACIPACPAPINLAVSEVTVSSATLNWSGTGDSYTIEWGPAGFAPGTGTVIPGVIGNTYLLLVPSVGAYEYYVTSHCGGDESAIAGPCVFLAGGYNLGDIPTQSDIEANISVNSTNYCTPEPALTIVVPDGYRIASLQVQYNMTAQNGAWKSEQRSFIYSPTLGAGESTIAVGVANEEGTMSYTRTLSFADNATGAIDFVLRAWRTWSTFGEEGCSTYNNYVNNNSWVLTPTFEPIPSCVEPTGITLDGLTAYTVDFSWDEGAGVEEYTWYLFEAGADPLMGEPIEFGFTETNSITIYGLTPQTSYDFYVTANCGGDGESGYSQMYNFTTLIACPAPTDLGYSEVSFTSAELSFMSDGAVNELKWGVAGFDVDTGGTLVNLEGEYSTVLEDLVPNAAYEFYVRRDCTDTNDGYSVWTGPFSFYVGYCQPSVPEFDDATGITRVIFGNGEEDDIDNPSGTEEMPYSNYTSISKEVEVGETHNLSVRVNTAGNFTVQVRAWIDWNNDGVFNTDLYEAGGEAYVLGFAVNTVDGLTNGSPKAIVIPNVASGEYRLRVKVVYGATAVPNPCTTQNYSETEDYTIIVVSSTDPCEGTPMPSAESPQAMTVGQTVADIVVDGENLTWYSDEELTTVVDETTVLEEGSYTFYVTQTLGDCTSAAIEVVVEVTLSTGGFDMASLKAYPNPVEDIFTISYSKNISEVTIINMLGQVVVKQVVNSTDAQVNMSALPTGNYVVKVVVDGGVQTLKIVKK